MNFQFIIKKFFDLAFALLIFLLSLPIFIVVGVFIKLDSNGPVFYRGERAGRFGKIFKIIKFRTMVQNAEKLGTIHASRNDPRITKAGRFLRRYKLDELPQLINILKGEMSFVGPRPQVKHYVDLYTEEERTCLNVLPGMTDYATIAYINQEDLVDEEDADKSYREKIEPEKNRLRVEYAKNNSLFIDVKIIFQTISVIIKKNILNGKKPLIFKKTAKTRMMFFMASDVILIALSVWLAFLFRFDAVIPSQYFFFIWRMVALAIIFIIPIFYFNKLYSFSWSYVSAAEAVSLFKATTIAFIFLSITIFVSQYFPHFQNFPRSTIFMSYFLVFIFSGALRFSKRIYLNIMGSSGKLNAEETLIVGAGDAGEQILRSIISSKNNSYLPVGFVDDNPIKQNISIHGFRVLGKISDMPKITAKYQVKQLIIALPTAGVKTISYAVELGRKSGLKKIKIAPHINEIISGEVSFKDLKNVEAESLLGRERVYVDFKEIKSFIKNKSILITGAAGSIGSELSRQMAKFNPSRILLLDQDETGIFNISEELKEKFFSFEIQSFVADIRDKKRINDIFKKFQPEIVFHAAAYKHVPLMEKNPTEAIKNNIFGTKILAEACLASGVERMIFISTDKAVNPSSVMGATKRVGEMICQAENQINKTKFISVRFGNVLDSRGSVIPKFREQIKKRGPVEITHPDMKRYFMLTSEACLLVMQSSAMGRGGEVFVLDMGEPIKIFDLAKEMIKLSGFEPDKDIPIVFTGIRPGEKLFEEILTSEEGTAATRNQKIFTAKLSNVNQKDLEEKLNELKDAADGFEKEKLANCLKKLVPYYNPQK